MVAFVFLPQNFGRWQEPMICTLSFYECRLSGEDTKRMVGTQHPPAVIEFI